MTRTGLLDPVRQDPGLDALHPQRFRGELRGELRARALRVYPDIYGTA